MMGGNVREEKEILQDPAGVLLAGMVGWCLVFIPMGDGRGGTGPHYGCYIPMGSGGSGVGSWETEG